MWCRMLKTDGEKGKSSSKKEELDKVQLLQYGIILGVVLISLGVTLVGLGVHPWGAYTISLGAVLLILGCFLLVFLA